MITQQRYSSISKICSNPNASKISQFQEYLFSYNTDIQLHYKTSENSILNYLNSCDEMSNQALFNLNNSIRISSVFLKNSLSLYNKTYSQIINGMNCSELNNSFKGMYNNICSSTVIAIKNLTFAIILMSIVTLCILYSTLNLLSKVFSGTI